MGKQKASASLWAVDGDVGDLVLVILISKNVMKMHT
jgi:hypothetical protein